MGDKDNFSIPAQEAPTKRKVVWNGGNNVFPNLKNRKERTRRLIQIGAIAIKYLDCPNDIEPTEFKEKIKSLVDGMLKNV